MKVGSADPRPAEQLVGWLGVFNVEVAMGQPELIRLSDSLKAAAPFKMQVLSAAELDMVSGGVEELLSDDCSCTVSACHKDGNDEPGTT